MTPIGYSLLTAAMLITLLLGGCSTQQTSTQPLPELNWPQRQQNLSPLQQWELQGKIAIRANQQNNAANLSWSQQQNHYHIYMAGPLGSGAVNIEGSKEHLRLTMAGEAPYETDEPEALLYEQLGWSFPLEQISWWIRGLPAPDSPYQMTLDPAQRLSELRQSGWHIRYPHYQQVDGLELPAKLVLTRGSELKITLVLKQWHFPSITG